MLLEQGAPKSKVDISPLPLYSVATNGLLISRTFLLSFFDLYIIHWFNSIESLGSLDTYVYIILHWSSSHTMLWSSDLSIGGFFGGFLVFFFTFGGFFAEFLQVGLALSGVFKAVAVRHLRRWKINLTATHVRTSWKL